MQVNTATEKIQTQTEPGREPWISAVQTSQGRAVFWTDDAGVKDSHKNASSGLHTVSKANFKKKNENENENEFFLLETIGKSLHPKIGKHPFTVISTSEIMHDPEE